MVQCSSPKGQGSLTYTIPGGYAFSEPMQGSHDGEFYHLLKSMNHLNGVVMETL